MPLKCLRKMSKILNTYLKETNVKFFAYQLKKDKPYRIVVRNLHHTTPIEYIKEELGHHGFLAKNITNVRYIQTKIPLQFFFVDLEPALNNKDIFEMQS